PRNDRDGHTLAGHTAVINRPGVVDGREVRRRDTVIAWKARVERRGRAQRGGRAVHARVERMAVKIREGNYAVRDAGDASRQQDLARVGLVKASIDFEEMDLGLKRLFHLTDRAREVDPVPSLRDAVDGKPETL